MCLSIRFFFFFFCTFLYSYITYSIHTYTIYFMISLLPFHIQTVWHIFGVCICFFLLSSIWSNLFFVWVLYMSLVISIFIHLVFRTVCNSSFLFIFSHSHVLLLFDTVPFRSSFLFFFFCQLGKYIYVHIWLRNTV